MEQKPPQKSNWILVLILAGMTIVAAFLIHSVMRGSRIEVAYGKLKEHIKQGHIKSLRLDATMIEGEFNQPQEDKYGRKSATFWTPRVGTVFDESLFTLLDQHKVDYNASSEPNNYPQFLLWTLVVGAIILAFYFLVFHRMDGGSAFSFGRSRAKLYAAEDLNISFDDVAGIDEAVEEIREIVDFLKTPQKYQVLGGRIPKGVLLVGPPGTGKTLLAKAVAGEANVPFFGMSGSEFVEMFVGVGAARIRDLFHQAEQKAPCIIFMDELDALGKTRTIVVGGHDEREQTLNQLLVEMDGFNSNRGVVMIAATNRPETLDPALLRPGRFDRNIVVDRPDINGREAILRVHARHVKIEPELDLRAIAALTPGLVGADLANLVNEAALLAARVDAPNVQKKHFDEAIERCLAGTERKNRVMLPEEKRRIAYHECGHAIVAYLLPGTDPVHKISIIPRGVAALGYTMQRPLEDRYLATQPELEHRISTLLGGTIAEEQVFGDISTGDQNDLERATRIARSMVEAWGMSQRMGKVCYQSGDRPAFLQGAGDSPVGRLHSETTSYAIDQEVHRILEVSAQRVREILQEYRDSLELLAERLLQKEVLSAEELKEVMDAHLPRIAPVTVSNSPLVATNTPASISAPLPNSSLIKEGENDSTTA